MSRLFLSKWISVALAVLLLIAALCEWWGDMAGSGWLLFALPAAICFVGAYSANAAEKEIQASTEQAGEELERLKKRLSQLEQNK